MNQSAIVLENSQPDFNTQDEKEYTTLTRHTVRVGDVCTVCLPDHRNNGSSEQIDYGYCFCNEKTARVVALDDESIDIEMTSGKWKGHHLRVDPMHLFFEESLNPR